MFPFRLVNPDPSKPFTIGRKSDNVLQFDNLMVSRYHAVLNFADGKWILQSLTQNSITMLNGKDVKSAVLSDGDVILIGPRQLRATLRGTDLTLLVMERETESDMQTVSLTAEWKDVVIPGISAGAKARICTERSKNASGDSREKVNENRREIELRPQKSNLQKPSLTRAANAYAPSPCKTGARTVLNLHLSGSATTICSSKPKKPALMFSPRT